MRTWATRRSNEKEAREDEEVDAVPGPVVQEPGAAASRATQRRRDRPRKRHERARAGSLGTPGGEPRRYRRGGRRGLDGRPGLRRGIRGAEGAGPVSRLW